MLSVAALAAAVLSVTAPAPVTALAADGDRVAYASGRAPYADCDRIRIWHRRTGQGLARLGRTTNCVQTSTGTGIAAMSIAGRRVLWLHYTGGNTREWSLFTATTRATTPKRIAFISQDVDEAAPVVIGEGDVSRSGNQLPYAVGREVRVLSENGARQATWTEPARVTALAAGGGGVIVATADGRVSIRSRVDWTQIEDQWTAPIPATAVYFAGIGVVAQRGRTLDYRGEGGPRIFLLPTGARLVDAAFGQALYLLRGRARLLDLQRGTTRDLGAATFAHLEVLSAIRASGRTVRATRVG